MQRGAWATLGLEAGGHRIPEDEAKDMLTILSCAEEDAKTFWAGWRAETALANPEWIAEMRRLAGSN
jgi:hypothetical protein